MVEVAHKDGVIAAHVTVPGRIAQQNQLQNILYLLVIYTPKYVNTGLRFEDSRIQLQQIRF